MSTTNDRLKRLREVNQIVEELEDKFDGDGRERTRSIRASLETAGRKINYGHSEEQLQDAMGETAGLAIDQGWHELADRALRLMDDEET